MSNLSEIYIKKETLETLLKVVNQKGEKGVSITVSTGDQTSQHGSNINAYVSQTKEQREAKKDKFMIGYGKVFWTDGKITVAEKKAVPSQVNEDPNEGDLPF